MLKTEYINFEQSSLRILQRISENYRGNLLSNNYLTTDDGTLKDTKVYLFWNLQHCFKMYNTAPKSTLIIN